jgi:hypothetical protein
LAKQACDAIKIVFKNRKWVNSIEGIFQSQKYGIEWAKTLLNYAWRVSKGDLPGLVRDIAKTLLKDVFAGWIKKGKTIGEAIKRMFRSKGVRDVLGLRRQQKRK